MNRKANIFNFGNVITELILAGMIILTLFAVVPMDEFNLERYKQDVYAADNALLIETMMAIPEAALDPTYFLESKHYEVRLTEERFIIKNERRRGAEVDVVYAGESAVKITPETITPRVYTYKKTPNSMTIDLVIGSQVECPPITTKPDWSGGTIIPKGMGLERSVLDGARQHLGTDVDIKDLATADSNARGRHELTIIRGEEENTAIITHGPYLETELLACYVKKRLEEANIPELQTVSKEVNNEWPATRGIKISIPRMTVPGHFERPIVLGYEDLFKPGGGG